MQLWCISLRIIIDGRICIQIKLKLDIFLEILQINKYNRGGDNCNGNTAAGQPLFLGQRRSSIAIYRIIEIRKNKNNRMIVEIK